MRPCAADCADLLPQRSLASVINGGKDIPPVPLGMDGSTIHSLALERALEAFNKNGDRASLAASQALDKLVWEERANVPPRR
ncbi:hypothetical protein CEK00_09635 [Stenotrophomonas maltophilia]|uniref:Uncharacterized protein n=1 Tax=Stenotrophomonas maltophilia TaxID=40324 RepID=A0A270MZL2_STEMA|nr:hypothetical protein CEK00_21955 [Stenotrophomonas maltophilia]PAM71842.1 hypothetical protein CEK00_09635 [Stenotrophomonas maltophilia]